MNSPDWASLIGALGVGSVLSAVVMYVTSRRQRSGRIGTSEATDLWAEQRIARQDAYAQLARKDAIIDDLRAKNFALEEQIIKERSDHAETSRRLREALEALEERNE